jgi:hypothetical protein
MATEDDSDIAMDTANLWTLSSGCLIIQANDIELGLTESTPENIDPSSSEGIARIKSVCCTLLKWYGQCARRMRDETQPAPQSTSLAAYTFLKTPFNQEYCLPSIQLLLELNLDYSNYSVDTISWPDAQIDDCK